MIIKSFSLNYEKLFEDYKIIHVYGENFHLKNEIVHKVSNIYKKNDYKVRIIKEDVLKNNIEILDQYLNQDSLFGEKEILVIEEATDKLLDYIKLEELEKKLILISENLQKKSALRNISEKQSFIACVACYDDDEKSLQSLLRNGLASLGVKVPSETIDQLFNINKLNRNDINSGLEKLSLITKDKKIDNETLSAFFNTTSSFDSFEISNALLMGDKKSLNKILSSFYHFTINFNEILGPLKYKINKLIDIYQYNENEKNLTNMVNNYKPPIFWKEKTIIQNQLNRWTVDELDLLLDKINDIEITCKLNYEISETIFNKFMLDIVSKKVLTNTYF